jgi:hypothetical protein
MDQRIKQRELSAPGSGGGSDLSVTHRVEAPSIEDVLRAARSAISAAKKTIATTSLKGCGCFGDD